MAVKKQTGITPEELVGPNFPVLMEPVWTVFKELNSVRGRDMNGLLSISYTDIKNYSELTGIKLNPNEVKALCTLDREYLRIMNV